MGKDALAPVIALLLILSGEAAAETPNMSANSNRPAIQVTGRGSVQAEPDVATVRIGVSTENADAREAVLANTAATAKVIATLTAASVDKKNIQTSNFSVYPQYRNDGGKRQALTYRVSNTVVAVIHDIAKTGDILSKVVEAGSNQIDGPVFSVSDPEKYLNEARKKAVENALAKAAAYAGAAGLKLGAILEMNETGGAAPLYPARAHSFAKSAAPAPVPIESGEESLEAQVFLAIELKQ